MKKKYLVIVESPTKAKTIETFLGPDFKVTASMGHIRQLSPTSDAIKADENIEFKWVVDKKKVDGLFTAIKSNAGIEKIYLATDMDREGEAISWHLSELIKEKNIKATLSRITFVEITKNAITSAIKNARDIDGNLVNAYFARTGLDHNVGFSISPILWSKLKFQNQSAGRVQSPAARIIVEREFLRNQFQERTYYSAEGLFKFNNIEFEGKLYAFENEKIPEEVNDRTFFEKMENIIGNHFTISEIVTKNINVRPDPPFTTSTLQQDGNKKLHIKIADIMKTAQELYEGVKINGKSTALITYMRTDSLNISSEALGSIFAFLKENFPNFCPNKPNTYKNKVKNAQEAHECIRPSYIHITPDSIKKQLTDNQYKIYNLIWQRTLASQMTNAIKEQVNFTISNEKADFKVTTTVIKDPGFLQIYETDKNKKHLPLQKGDKLEMLTFNISEHKTQPPARFSEATLIQELEKHGIGRPSTYVSIVETLLKREYIIKKQKFLEATFKGEITCCFLRLFFGKYVDYQFTANIEEFLDKIANGEETFEGFLKEFMKELAENIEKVKNINNFDILKDLSLPITEGLNKKCECGNSLSLRVKFSFFFICEKCNKTYKTSEESSMEIGNINVVKTETYQYMTKGDVKIYLPTKFNEELTDETVALITSLPRSVGKFNGTDILAGMSKFGFYLKVSDKYYSIQFKQLQNLNEENAINIIQQAMLRPVYKKYDNKNNENVKEKIPNDTQTENKDEKNTKTVKKTKTLEKIPSDDKESSKKIKKTKPAAEKTTKKTTSKKITT